MRSVVDCFTHCLASPRFGSPFGFDHSVTAGIVSAKGRALPRENYVPFIQTDVAINPGNSGGPLFNLKGQGVGVNSQIFSRTGGFMGLSFAITIDVAMEVADQLRNTGKVSRGWLGVLIQDVTRELAESFGMPKPQGALVARVLADSPAAEAGFQVGDVVLAFDSKTVSRSSDLPPIVGRTRVGKEVPVQILRKGKPLRLTVKTAELPEEPAPVMVGQTSKGQTTSRRLGVTVSNPTADQRKKHGLKQEGIVVVATRAGPARDAGVRQGDIILMLNNASIEDVATFREVVSELPAGKPASILVQRDGNPIFLAVKLPD